MTRRFRSASLLVALLAGAVAGRLLLPAWREHRALTAIAAPDAETRSAGWAWLLAPARAGAAPYDRLAAEVTARLEAAGDEALLHGSAVLRGRGRWGWSEQDRSLVLRETALRAALPLEDEKLEAADTLRAAPRDVAWSELLPIVQALLDGAARPTRRAALELACSWLGRDRAARLADLAIPAGDDDLERTRQLALGWARPPAPAPATPGGATADVVEAALLRSVLAAPDDAGAVLEHLAAHGESASGGEALAVASILRLSRDLRAVRALERLAREGDRAARYALQARRPALDDAQARSVVDDPSLAPTTRRLAAWRWDRVPPEALREVLALEPAEADGDVYAAALLAERRLPRPEAVPLAEGWIRSFNDDEKRAGALLAALLGERRELLARAFDLEDVGAVRTGQRLALWAMGERTGDEDPVEFAYRTLHLANGDFRGDTALCLLLAGRAEALALLTSRPPSGAKEAVQQRAWLIERFAPEWHAAVGRPIGGSERGLRLHFDVLDALRLLTERDLHFVEPEAVYREARGGAGGAD